MIVGFDIGGTTIKGAAVSSLDAVGPVRRLPTPGNDFEAFAAALRSVIAENGTKPNCVAIAIAGVIDPDSRRAICANIPCVHGRTIEADLEKALGLPVVIANDADCFALAEAVAGAGRGHPIVFGTILGTGVGGGLVARGKLINASGGFAGEWGHGPVAALLAGDPPVAIPRLRCGCGLEGCLDATVSARGMERLHAHLHNGAVLTAEAILAAWQAGDTDATRTIGVFVDILASPLAMVVNVTGATIVPVGGGLSNSEALVAEVDRAVRARVLRRFERPLVVRGACRIEPGLIGAAILGLERAGHALRTA